MTRLIWVGLAAAGGIGAVSFSGAAPAQPAGTCLSVNGTPKFVTGRGSDQTQSMAKSYMESQWRSKAAYTYGPAYSNWNKAAGKSGNCWYSGTPFRREYTCQFTARPCT